MKNKAFICALFCWSSVYGLDSVQNCKVFDIHDGDTLKVVCDPEEDPIRVRLYCIDAPELKQPYGIAARETLKELIGPQSFVSLRVYNKDLYGRLIAEIFVDRVNIGFELVTRGAVSVYPQFCKDKEYFAEEAFVKFSKLGIWGEEGLHQTPWLFRHNKNSHN